MVIKQGVSNPSVFFNLDGLDYPKSQWTLIFNDISKNSDGSINEDKVDVGIRSKYDVNYILVQPQPIPSWRDGSDTPYSDLDTLITDLTTLLDLGSGSTSGVVPNLQAVLDIGNQANTQIEIDTTAFSGADALVGINFNPTAGNGVSGYSNVGSGVRGESNSGVGVYGQSETGVAGFFLKNGIGVFDDIIVGNYQGNDVFKVKYTGDVNANSFIKSGGTSSQFLKADGSVDSNTYLTGTSGWSLSGNAGTDPLTNFIGTTDDADLVLRTNNIEIARILSNGNFGINTIGASAPLELRSPIVGSNVIGTTLIQRIRRTNTTGVKFNNTLDILVGTYTTALASNTRVDFNISDGATSNPDINVMTFTGNNVGINTLAPAERLHVTAIGFGANQNRGIRISSTNGEWVARFALLSDAGAVPRLGIFAPINGAGGTNESLTLYSNGFVGFSVTAPTDRVHIAGNLRLTGAIKDSTNSAGTNGFILSSTGTGTTTTWIDLNSRFVDKEIPSGLINSSNTIFTLANTPVVGSEHVYKNGLLQQSGIGNDYTISGSTITYLTAPTTGDKILVSYRK